MQDPHPAVSGKGIAQLEEAGVEVIMMVDFENAARVINLGFFLALSGQAAGANEACYEP